MLNNKFILLNSKEEVKLTFEQLKENNKNYCEIEINECFSSSGTRIKFPVKNTSKTKQTLQELALEDNNSLNL